MNSVCPGCKRHVATLGLCEVCIEARVSQLSPTPSALLYVLVGMMVAPFVLAIISVYW